MEFWDFLKCYIVWQLDSQIVFTISVSNNHIPFYLKEIFGKISLSNKRLRDIGHSMNIGNLILGVNSATVSYLIRYDSLLQNLLDVITKCDRNLLQNASGFLLQNATVIANCGDFIAKCDRYYKMQRLLQITTVHEVNFSIIQLSSEEQICFNASRVELNWSYLTLIALIDLWASRILWLLDFLILFLNVTWHWVRLVDGPNPNLRLGWGTIFCHLQVLRTYSNVRWNYIVNVFFIHVFDDDKEHLWVTAFNTSRN